MHVHRIVLIGLLLAFASVSRAADGLITLRSPHSAAKTMQRLEQQVKQRDLNIFARIDHSTGAASVGQSLRPTLLLLFGHPRGGTPFMACAQTVGIDLPLKALVWQDASGQVWLGYNDPAFIAQRHGARQCQVIAKMQNMLDAIAQAAVTP